MEDTTQGKIWRINMKTEGIIGIGWSRAISKDTFSEEVTNPKEIQTFIWSSSEKWGSFFKWYRL